MAVNFFQSVDPILIEGTRSNRREALHVAHCVLCNSSGELLGYFGEYEYETYERSLAKPLQLLTAIRQRPSIADECSLPEIGIMAASHSGEPEHIRTLTELRTRYGLEEECFKCGFHPPFTPEAVMYVGRNNIILSPIYHNCSGKHIGMLLACEAKGWPYGGYQQPDHPLQIENHKLMSRYTDVPYEELRYGVDGCGVPTWWMSLKEIAVASARYADPEFREDEFESRVKDLMFEAFHKAAWYTAGTGRFGTPFNEESDGKWLGKIGGEAVFGVSFRNTGLGIGIKVVDGNSRALGPALLHAMKVWDLVSEDQLERLRDWVKVPRHNAPGQLIGYMQVVE